MLQAKALRKLKFTHQDDYAKRGADDRRELARILFKEATAQTNEAEKFVTLREVVELAAQTGEADLACSALDALARTFTVDGLTQKGLVLDKIAKLTALSAEQSGQLGEHYLALGDEVGGLCQREPAAALLAKGKAILQRKPAKDDVHCQEVMARIGRRLAYYQKLLAVKDAPWDADWQHDGQLMDYHNLWEKVDHSGHRNIWQTCPSWGATPFRWTRKVQVAAGKSTILHVETCSNDLKGDRPMRRFVFVAAANGKELVRTCIIGSPWHSFDFPLDEFAGQEALLELRNHGAPTGNDGFPPVEGDPFPPVSYWDNVRVIELP
jgi:hypothetical protein